MASTTLQPINQNDTPFSSMDQFNSAGGGSIVTINPGDRITNQVQYYKYNNNPTVFKNSEYSNPSKSVSVITSNDARTATNNNINGVNNAEQAITDNQQNQTSTTNNNTNTGTGTETNTETNVFAPKASDSPEVATLKTNYQAASDAYTDYKTKVDQIMNGSYPLSPTDQAIIDGIKASIDNQVAAQQKLNTAQLNSLTLAGERSGRARYTAESNIDTLSDEQTQGLQRISNIQTKGLQLIAQAKQAIQDRNFKMLNDAYTAFQNNNKQQTDALLSLMKVNQDAETQAMEKIKLNLQIQKADQDAKNDLRDFATKNNIQQPFYELAGHVYDASTGDEITTPEQAKKAGIKDDFSNVQVVDSTQHSPAYVEYLDAMSNRSAAGQPMITFEQYQNEDANRKAKIAASGAPKTYNENKDAAQNVEQQKVGGYMDSKSGKDGYVAPEDYKKAKSAWVQDGYSAKDFDSIYSGYVNPADAQDYGVNFQTKISSNG